MKVSNRWGQGAEGAAANVIWGNHSNKWSISIEDREPAITGRAPQESEIY